MSKDTSRRSSTPFSSEPDDQDFRDKIQTQGDLDLEELLRRAEQELIDRGGAKAIGLDPNTVQQEIDDIRVRAEELKVTRHRYRNTKAAGGFDGRPQDERHAEADLLAEEAWVGLDIENKALDAGRAFKKRRPDAGKKGRIPDGRPARPVTPQKRAAGFAVPGSDTSSYGRGGLGNGSPYGKGASFSGSSSSPFTAGNDTSGAGNPYAVGGAPGYGDQQAGSNKAQTSYGGSVQAGAGSPGYDDEQANADDTQADETQAAETDDSQSEREKQSGSGSGPDPEGNQGAGTPTYEGNEKGWVSAQALNRVFQLIGGGNGARGTPGGIRKDSRQPGPSISGFSGVSNPLAPYIRTTGEEGSGRFGGPRGGMRGVDPRNIRSDNAGWGGSSRSVREVDTASFGPRDKFGGGSPIGPDPNARNPFETRASVVSKNRR